MPLPRPLRPALIVLGLALAVYGTASLTGGWLGMAPWWERAQRWSDLRIRQDIEGIAFQHDGELYPDPPMGMVARDDREWISVAVIAVGVGLAASGAWPRRRALTGTRA